MLQISVLWLVTKDRELLLQKRSLTKKFHPGEWGPTMTGTSEEGETPEQTLVREVGEELGLTRGDYQSNYLFTTDFDHPDGQVRRFSIYFAIVEKDIVDRITVDASEVAELRWLPMEKIKEMLPDGTDDFKIVGSAKTVWPETFEKIENAIKSL